jgi:16S rRNA (guanine527-N7)-methyltransferase
MLDEISLQNLLEPFELRLNSGQISQMLVYLDLLLKWNPKINLTSIRSAEEIVTRHFGESLYLARWAQLDGSLLDVGSGAGFPGLALKIAFPDLSATMLEPIAKKRAFLKEVVRACGFNSVEVLSERLNDFVSESSARLFNTITARAVGHLERLVPQGVKILNSDGRLCLWVGQKQGNDLNQSSDRIAWDPPIAIPLGREREIWVGRKKSVIK